MLTRYALIDPILRALDWDTEDPSQVKPEFSMRQRRSDYALLYDGRPLVMVEAKALSASLLDARSQGVSGAVLLGVPYFVCTDGDTWEVYDALKPRPLDEKRVVQVRLSRDNPGEAARQLLALWRPAMLEVRTVPEVTVQPAMQPSPEVRVSSTSAVTTPQLPSLTLYELLNRVKPGDKPPQRLRFSDGTVEQLSSWKDLPVATAKWALPKLQERSELPMRSATKRYGPQGRWLIKEGSEGMTQPELLSSGWYIETHWASPRIVKHACRILEAAGVDPATVFVEG